MDRDEGDSRTMWHIPDIWLGRFEGPRKFVLWKSLISGIIVAVILIVALIGNNRMQGNAYKCSMNIFLIALLTVDLWAVWKCVKYLRNSRSLRSD